MMIDLFSQRYMDKVLGCWVGKNCGGTLGGPLEIAWGLEEPFDVWWYPRVEPGGIPNDDLELQLVWLKALEEIGPGLRAADFANYWLTHIGYNPDEYGMSKTNLRLGLTPPVSGYFNNAFRDCMGSPIRSELWACVAPGQPRLAVRYAYEDAICDHAGGEGVYGSLFNTAVESAAFVVSDARELIKIGLSYIPENSFTARAVRAAVAAHAEGVDWKVARERVLQAAPHSNAQYAPPNIGFQIVGWLYGTDFGDALCKAVNCGYDTDCTGATLGSYLGIVGGAASLPARWTAPLGETIAVNAPPAIRHAEGFPGDLHDLTARVRAQAVRVLAWHGIDTRHEVRREDLFANDAVRALWTRDPLRVDWPLASLGSPVAAALRYHRAPVIRPGGEELVSVELRNTRPDPLTVTVSWTLPSGWRAVPASALGAMILAAGETRTESWRIHAPVAPGALQESNHLELRIHCAGHPAMPTIPVIFLAPIRARRSELFPLVHGGLQANLEAVFSPELLVNDTRQAGARVADWTDFYAEGNALGNAFVEGLSNLSAGGVLYVQTFVWLPVETGLRVGASAPCPAKIWVNETLVAESLCTLPTRPSYAGLSHPEKGAQAYGDHIFRAGWNEILLKFVLPASATPLVFDPHLTLAVIDQLHAGLIGALRHYFPWEAPVGHSDVSNDSASVAIRPMERIPVAKVWAGHPVGFEIRNHKGRQYVAYYDANRAMTVAARPLTSREWTSQVLPSRVGWDSHNYITMDFDRDDQLHVVGNLHVSPLVYFRTTTPGDITTLTPVDHMAGDREQRMTYPLFIRLRDESLLFGYRDGASGNGVQLYNRYDEKTRSWVRWLDEPVFDGRNKMNAYLNGPLLGPDGWWHAVWVWRDTPDAATNHDLSYARSRDLIRWETAAGSPLTLPLTIESPGLIVDPIPVHGGIINGTTGSLGFDDRDRPVIAYHKFDETGATQLYLTRFENHAWKPTQVTRWTYRWEPNGTGSIVHMVNHSPLRKDARLGLFITLDHQYHGKSHWRIDPVTLAPTDELHAEEIPGFTPEELHQVVATTPGLRANLAAAQGDRISGERHVLRWETLGPNRDMESDSVPPPPTLLEVIVLPDLR